MWNKLTTRLSNLFSDEKRHQQLRPSRSLTALNHKTLRVNNVRSSRSIENLHRVNSNLPAPAPLFAKKDPPAPAVKPSRLSKKSSARDLFRLGSKKKPSPLPQDESIPSVAPLPSSAFPMSLSWTEQLGDLQPGPFDVSGAPAAYGNKPKRSKSITTMNHVQGSAPLNGGFCTPQALATYKCTTQPNGMSAGDKFWSLDRRQHLQTVRNNDSMYRRLEKIGEGSYATVIKGVNKLDGSIVALKEIKLQAQEGLPFTAIREISLLRGLKHANIVSLYQIIHQAESLVLVFEYVKTDLSKFMENYRNGLDDFRTRLFLFQLLRGLAYCHERKILHRDLKPQNLLVSEHNELKLADFGLARAKSVPCRTFSHDVVTLWYRPPDVLLGSTQYSTSLDMWGVGCIFAEMLTGLPLFPGVNNASDQLERIFTFRGVPDPAKWPEVVGLPGYSKLNMPNFPEVPWRNVHPALGRCYDGSEKLLNAFLQLNPARRISAQAAMLCPYFAPLPPEVHLLKPTESIMSVFGNSPTFSRSRSRSPSPSPLSAYVATSTTFSFV